MQILKIMEDILHPLWRPATRRHYIERVRVQTHLARGQNLQMMDFADLSRRSLRAGLVNPFGALSGSSGYWIAMQLRLEIALEEGLKVVAAVVTGTIAAIIFNQVHLTWLIAAS